MRNFVQDKKLEKSRSLCQQNTSRSSIHSSRKEGVTPLAKSIVKLAMEADQSRLRMGRNGSERVKEMFLEHYMSHRIASVLREVLQHADAHA